MPESEARFNMKKKDLGDLVRKIYPGNNHEIKYPDISSFTVQLD